MTAALDDTGPPKPVVQRIASRMATLGRRRIRPTSTVLQLEAVECGAAALAMILAYHGLWVPLEQLRIACGVSRDGTKASNILNAARHLGLAAKGFKKEPATLHELPMPCIIHWNFNHFVVLEGLRQGRAYINDPAVGRRRVDLAEFNVSFTGVVLAMVPAEGFRKAGRKPQFFRIIARDLQRSKSAVALLLAVSLALVVPGIVIPSFSKIFVDGVLVDGLGDWLTPLLIGMAITAAGRAFVTALQQSLLLRLETKLSVTMITRFLWHVLSLPMEFFTQRHAGDIAARIASNERIARLLSGGLAANALNLCSLVFFAAAMAIYDLGLAAAAVGISLLNIVALKLVARRREDINRGLALESGKLSGSTVGIIRTIETLKATGFEDDAFARWAGLHARVLNAEQSLGFYSAALEVVPTFLAMVTTALIFGIGGLRVIDGALTIGSLVAFQSLAASFAAPLNTLVQLTGSFQTIKGDLSRIEDVFNYPADAAARAGGESAETPPKLAGRLALEKVSFGYSPLEPPLIDRFSLALEPGTRVALVGASGSGKSTLGRLICGLCKPWTGEIYFDGWRLSDIPPPVFASSVAYVDQDVFLFEGTVRENLTLWDATVAESEIATALKDAAIHDEVAARPGNYDCYVNEGGTNFSGGQRQRIEIARALVGNPSILVLDEATAALDPATEQQIDDNLRRRGCSCIIIAHRLSTIRDCDEIIVLDRGRVRERGTHDELMMLGGAYAKLVAQE
jgi:NHLM bacteriocin system ABC transporter peptidase/ATP-binding protein